jgi:putative radical SAM enzyme (TIGR03279 family)
MEYQPDLKNITGVGGAIAAIVPASIAAELGLQPGDLVLAVGDRQLRDVIDYRFAIAEERIELLVRRGDEQTIYEIEKDADEDLGIEFVEPLFDRLRTCNNKCPFCFLTQMPKGMRKSLYLKDDDYRLGFLYGNFVTLTNLNEHDWQRIEEQHLSPMYRPRAARGAAW